MEIISDLQIHSRFSRATSKDISFQNLEKYAKIKGLNLLSTGDFQHPLQFRAINEELEEDENGILWTKTKFPFLWQTEISLIYTHNGKGQRIHHLIFSPNKDVAKQIIDALSRKGRLDYDGRPIFGFNSIELVDMMRSISDEIEIIPAHIWTSHFSLMGEYNQLSKVEDCFKDNTKYIHALETGMSCYDKKTEILTEKGWKKFSKVLYDDKICTLNQKTGNIEFQKPTKVFSYKYKGKMYRLRTKRVDLLVTPNHKLLISHCNFRKPTHFLLKEAELAFRKSKRLKKDGIWVGKHKEYFKLPAVKIRHGSRYYSGFRNKAEKLIQIKAWLKFFGFWLAEGWVTIKDSDYGVYISNRNKDLIMEMKRILESFGYNVYYDDKVCHIRVRDFQLCQYLKQFGKCYDKYIPKDIKALSKELLEILFEYYIKGDGHIYGRNSKGLSATTSSIRLRDDLQEIALKLGISAYYKLHRRKGTLFSSPSQKKKYKQRNDTWVIYFIRKNIHTVLPSTIKKYGYTESWVNFNGRVFCVEVPNHVVYIRRNGIPVWCGNSDPAMNWRISNLDRFQLVSFSDAHSSWPWRLGRETTIFDFKELTYKNFIKAIRTGEGLKSTIETYTSYGKYHFTGHRVCGVSFSPEESKRLNYICPKCKHKLTVGVADRVEQLADRPVGYVRENSRPFISIIPLHELIAVAYGVKQLYAKKVWDVYNSLIKRFGNEFDVLLKAEEKELKDVINDKLVELIKKNREDKLRIKAGYDGLYGTIILEDKEVEQKTLSGF